MNLIQDLLTINEYSRPGTKLKGIKGIVVHWVANPNTSAKANRNFFENRKNGKSGYGSAHYIIDLNGSVLQCIPNSEVAYHVGAKSYKKTAITALGTYPNSTTLGIECTHTDWNGKMTNETYDSLVELCKDLCMVYKLDPMSDLYRHYDITGKDCHKWFVNNPAEWKKFKKKVLSRMPGNSNKSTIKVKINNQIREIPGGIKNGTNFIKIGQYEVPIRDVGEALGFKVGWDNASKVVLFQNEEY